MPPATRRASDSLLWQPQPGWGEVRPGIWEPAGYEPGPWELTPPAVVTPEDEIREYLRCANSLPYFALHYCFALHVDDPEGAQPRRLPAYPYIRELLTTLQVPSNTVSDKSRQMLTSWLYMAAFLSDLLFVANTPMLVASRRQKEVDDGGAESTVDSLLGKLRFMHERLPRFLWHPVTFKLFRATSTVTGSYVRGETGAGGQVARGPAYRRALADEFAYAQRSESMFTGLKQSCKRGLHLNSTANGKGNAFYRLVHSKTTSFTKIRLHWTKHPEYAAGLACLCGWSSRADAGAPVAQFEAHRTTCRRQAGPAPTSPWYRLQQQDFTPEQVAQDIDISYERSTNARVFDGYDAGRHVFDVAAALDRRTGQPIGDLRVGETDLEYRRRVLPGLLDPGKPLVIFWDFGVSDETAVHLGQVVDEATQATVWLDEVLDRGKAWTYYHRHIMSVWYPSYLEACGWTPDRLQAWADRKELDWSTRPLCVPDFQTEVPRGCLPVYHAGDPAGRQRDSSLSSWTRNLANAEPPMLLQTVPFAKPDDGSMLDWIDHVRDRVRRDQIHLTNLCTRLADALSDWRWPTDKDGNVLPGRQMPVHDKHSHSATALVMGYRTRWRGQLVISGATRPTAAMAYTERDDHTGGPLTREPGTSRRRRAEPVMVSTERDTDDPDDADDDESLHD